jgi:biopolymer transport protein ExbD
MAGAQNIGEASENPVALNVTAIVDIVFCLCLFFMCSLKFKQLEGRIETWLPRTGTFQTAVVPPPIDQIRVTLTWDHAKGRTIRKVGAREAESDLAFQEALLRYPKQIELTVAVDAGYDVPWRDAVRVIDLCKRNRFEKVEFVEPWEQPH